MLSKNHFKHFQISILPKNIYRIPSKIHRKVENVEQIDYSFFNIEAVKNDRSYLFQCSICQPPILDVATWLNSFQVWLWLILDTFLNIEASIKDISYFFYCIIFQLSVLDAMIRLYYLQVQLWFYRWCFRIQRDPQRKDHICPMPYLSTFIFRCHGWILFFPNSTMTSC